MMNEPFENAPSDVRASVVYPKQSDYRVVAISNPAYLQQPGDEYQKRIAKHIDLLNRQEKVLARDKSSMAIEMQDLMAKKEIVEHDGQRVHQLLHSLGWSRRQESIDLFESFNKNKGNYFVFDIETFGDSQDRNKPFGISEIAINEYDKQGDLVNKTYNTIVHQDEKVVNRLQKRIDQLKVDPYLFNSLPGWEQRSLVDLMRYSTYADEADGNAFNFDKKSQTIKHHSIIKSVFNEKDELERLKVVRGMQNYLNYMQSGLDLMKSSKVEGESAILEVARIMAENPDKVFVSYNGNAFDMPVLQAYAKNKGVTLPSGVKHLDYLNVIHSVYMDSDDLKRQVNPEYKGSAFGKDKLAAFREILEQSSQDDAHNAQVDTDDTAKIVAKTREHIQEALSNAQSSVNSEFGFHPTGMTWNKSPMYTGQKLFAVGGVQAFKDGDESFRVKLDDNGKWVEQSSDFNKTVINARSFYEFAGHQVMEDGRQAFRFYNPDLNEYSYIVREGEHAFAELQDFVQSRFYNWENVDSKVKEKILHVTETDRARRRYDSYFSMDGAGKGLALVDGQVVEKGTKGFSGLKRMLENAEIMETYLDSNRDFKNRVEELIEQGMSRNEAKRAIRKIRTSELHDLLTPNFESLWDPIAKQYTYNEKEMKHFFKMHQRLIDEMPYLGQAVKMIDANFSDDIQRASEIEDHGKRNAAFREINQKRDQALMRYYESVKQEVGTPVEKRKLNSFESQRLSYFDPEAGDTRSINFETVGTAQGNLFSYAKRGVEEGADRHRFMQERLFNLMELLRSEDKISGKQYKHYVNTLHESDSIWHATQEIASDMRKKSGGIYDTHREEPVMHHNENIKTLNQVLEKKNMSNELMIRRAIQDTENAFMIMDMNAIKGQRLVLGEKMKETLDIMDRESFSRLRPNNYQALEELVSSIHETDKSKHIAMTMGSPEDANMKLYVYDPKDSISVQNQLQRGTTPSQALEIEMPLISESGVHKVGGQVINAHSYAVLDGKDVNMISSAQHISRDYKDRMKWIMNLYNQGDVDGANYQAKNVLRESIMNMSGIQRNMVGENDSYRWANNRSDYLKQQHVKLDTAMIEDFYYNGYNDFKLTEEHFYDPDDVFVMRNGKKVLRKGVTADVLTMDASHKMMMMMPEWAEEKLKMDFSTSSLKAEHVSKMILSTEDIRQMIPYGTFYNHGRDNAVQYENAYLINDETNERLKGISGVSRNNYLKTERQLAYEAGRPDQYGINMKTAYMTNDEFRAKIESLHQTENGKALLNELGFLDEKGKINWMKLPRVYEQQGIIAKDVADALRVDNEKRYAKGQRFEMANGLKLNSEVQPGEFLGTRTHDNGLKEDIFYEGTRPARVAGGAAGDGDLILRWQEDPFKLMLDGEKMTDSPVHRSLIQAVTGRDDIVTIINPDVAKHKDYGMLMSGEARLMAESIQQLNEKDKLEAIRIIEKGKIGLTWDDQMGGFIDHSYDLKIAKDQFNKVFDELQKKGFNISPITDTGVRYGILQGIMSKVSNYSKVVDFTGNRVLHYDETWDEIGQKMKATKMYGGIDGVRWGHREMGVLKSYGMDKTYEHVYQMMKEKSERLGEVDSIAKSLRYMTEEHAEIAALSVHDDFKSLPQNFRNRHMYKGTIFDQKESLLERFAGNSAVTDHGFWMELPGVESADGGISQVKVNLGEGKEKLIDKIFIPFTAVEGADGDIHLRDIQKRIANIYRKADAVNQAESIESARQAQVELQGAVNSYVRQSFKELTSSEGMMFENVFKATMGGEYGERDVRTSSASGLFKLMDYQTSLDVMERWGDGQYTIISEDMAKKMGVFDQLKEGKELYAANVRYPTFHDGAMQFAKLRMADWVKDGEMHTTSFSSMLQNADSDGDYSHIVVMDDEQIQEEWKQAHDNIRNKYEREWRSHVEKESHQSRLTHNLINANSGEFVDGKWTDSQWIQKQKGNTDEQMAAKIGKMTIGRASNLNLFIRQVADAHYDMDSEMNYQIKKFGQGIEQKLIDAKHGAKPKGIEMIDAIYSGNWEKAFEIDNDSFEGNFQKNFYMREVAEELPMALKKVEGGLRANALKFGTSTGIGYSLDSDQGIQTVIDYLHGNQETGVDNKGLGLYHKHLREMGESLAIDQLKEQAEFESLQRHALQERVPLGLKDRAKNVAGDFIGGGISNLGEKVSQAWSSIKGMSARNQMLFGGGLAVAGVAGYNILNTEKPEMHYNNQDSQPAIDMPEADGLDMQNASISISATGGELQSDQVSHAVSQGMRESRMNAGPTRMTVNHQDNTQQLNRQWYRDTVRENI